MYKQYSATFEILAVMETKQVKLHYSSVHLVSFMCIYSFDILKCIILFYLYTFSYNFVMSYCHFINFCSFLILLFRFNLFLFQFSLV